MQDERRQGEGGGGGAQAVKLRHVNSSAGPRRCHRILGNGLPSPARQDSAGTQSRAGLSATTLTPSLSAATCLSLGQLNSLGSRDSLVVVMEGGGGGGGEICPWQ